MNAKQAYNKLMAILAEQMKCAIVELWFDKNSAAGEYCTPCGIGDIQFVALVDVTETDAKVPLIGIERTECDLEDDFVGWARLFVEYKVQLNDDDSYAGLYIDGIQLVGVSPVVEQPDAAPIADEPIPF